MFRKFSRTLIMTAVLTGVSTVHAASFYLAPDSSTVDLSTGTATVGLHMDFSGEISLGGGLILDISGPISVLSFSPSSYFDTLDVIKTVSQCPGYNPGNPATFCDPDTYDFTGYGTGNKPSSAAWEIHLGSFSGITGAHKLGDLTLVGNGGGLGTITLGQSPDQNFGPFVDLLGASMQVSMTGATVNAVPIPAAAWLFITALGTAGAWRRHRIA